jgi:hypothetical protein
MTEGLGGDGVSGGSYVFPISWSLGSSSGLASGSCGIRGAGTNLVIEAMNPSIVTAQAIVAGSCGVVESTSFSTILEGTWVITGSCSVEEPVF